MRTIITNDLETHIRTTETIKLTSKGVSSEVLTSMIGDNEANELAGISTGPDISNATTDPRTLIRTDGDVIYKDANDVTMTKTSEGFIVYDFPTDFTDADFKLECNAAMLEDKYVFLNITLGLYINGFVFESISEYSENAELKLYMDSTYLGSMKISDLINYKYSILNDEVSEDADEEEKQFAKVKSNLYHRVNSIKFANAQIAFKVFIVNNENVNARGFLKVYAHVYEVDETGKIITNSIRKILYEGETTSE